ncbi:MAG: hypothetical protein WCK33_08235 [Phycisphaerae bacterium]
MRLSFRLVEALVAAAMLAATGSWLAPRWSTAGEPVDALLTSRLASLQRRIERFHEANGGRWPDFAARGWGTLTDRGTLIGGGFIETAPLNPAFPGPDKASIEVAERAGVRGSPHAAWVWNVPECHLYASGFDERLGRGTGRPVD